MPGNQDFESQEAQVEEVQLGRVLWEALRSLDGVDVGHLFSMRAVLLKSHLRTLKEHTELVCVLP